MTPEQMRELADELDMYVGSPTRASYYPSPVLRAADFLRQCAEQRPCTCHPDDNPPVPCAQKYALNECRATRSGPDEAQIKARDALLDFISENGTASEGVQYYLDRYVRAALAAKDRT